LSYSTSNAQYIDYLAGAVVEDVCRNKYTDADGDVFCDAYSNEFDIPPLP
jgi:hypothetical protein